MTNSCESIETRLSGYLDGELTQQESQHIYLHIQKCESCGRLYQELKQMQQSVAQLEMPSMSEKQLQQLMTDGPASTLQWTGWSLLVGGLSVVIGFVLIQFITDSSVPVWLKLTFSAIFGGLGFLLGSVVRQRIIARKTDRYKKVDL